MEHLELPVKSANPLQGSGVPDNSLGSDGNLYINTDDGKIYYKISGAWLEGAATALPTPAQSLQAAFNGGSSISSVNGSVSIVATGPVSTDALYISSSPDDEGSGSSAGSAINIQHTPIGTCSDYAVEISTSADASSSGGLLVDAINGARAATFSSVSSDTTATFTNYGSGAAFSADTSFGSGAAIKVKADASSAHFLLNAETSGSISLKVPATVTTHSLTLPSAQGAADSYLKNNGSGALSWSPISTFTLSEVLTAGNTYAGPLSLILNTSGGSAIGVQSTVFGAAAINYFADSSSSSGRAFSASVSGAYGTAFYGDVNKGSGLLLNSTSVEASNPSPMIGMNLYSTLTPIISVYGPSFSGPFRLNIPNSLTAYAWTLPVSQGAPDSFMRNDGLGNLSWVQAAAANGLATLDAGGKVPAGQLPSSVFTLEGTWDASTNTPTLVDGTGNAGMIYLVTVAGSQNLGSGSQTFAVGDWVLYNSSNIWQQSNNSTSVVSVNGYTGVVSLVKGDIGLGNVDNTSDSAKNSATVTLTNKKLDDATTSVVDTSDPTVQLKFNVTGTAGTKTTLTSGQTADRIIVLPDVAGTVGLVPASGPVRSNGSILQSGNTSLTSEVSGVLPMANGGSNSSSISSGLVRSNGTTLSGAATVALGTEVSGTLPVTNGGTGNNTLAVDGVLLGNGSSSVAVAAAGSNDQVFRVPGVGVQPSFGAIDLTKAAAVTGALGIANGGTGQTTAVLAFGALSPLTTKGDIQTFSTLGTRLPVGADGKALLSDSTQATGLRWGDPAAAGAPPIGSVIAYNPGYYTNGSNGSFTVVGPASNNEASVNTYLNSSGWYVCNGAAVNNPSSPVWNAAGRFLPNLSDSRFLMGSTASGSVGGNNSSAHYHNLPAHYHSAGAGSTASTTIGYTSPSLTDNVVASSGHTHTYDGIGARSFTAGSGLAYTNGGSIISVTPYTTTGISGSTTVNISGGGLTGSNTVTGFYGLFTGGVDGNAIMSSGVATVTENRPVYLSCFYIVRVF